MEIKITVDGTDYEPKTSTETNTAAPVETSVVETPSPDQGVQTNVEDPTTADEAAKGEVAG